MRKLSTNLKNRNGGYHVAAYVDGTDYDGLSRIAYEERKSIAQVLRDAVNEHVLKRAPKRTTLEENIALREEIAKLKASLEGGASR